MATTNCPTTTPRGDSYSGWHTDYNAVYNQDPAYWISQSPSHPAVGEQTYAKIGVQDIWSYRIRRGLFGIDLSGLPSTIYVTEAKLVLPQARRGNFREPAEPTGNTQYAVIVGANGIASGTSAFGDLRSRNGPLAMYPIPPDARWETIYDVEIPFANSGIQWIQENAGNGDARLGIRTIRDIIAEPPGLPNTRETVELTVSTAGDNQLYLSVTYTAEEPPVLLEGYIWVEGTNLAYLDGYRTKRVEQGDATGNTGTAGHVWAEGDYLHYVDSSGNERRLLDSLTGRNTGKVAGQIGINYVEGGTKLCYIDDTGAERCFEGAIA